MRVSHAHGPSKPQGRFSTAVKVPRRSRRTSWEVLRSVHRGVQLALRFRHLLPLRFKGSPAHVSALAGTSTRLVIRPVMRASSGRRPGPAALAFLLPFSRRHSLPGHPVPPAGFRPSYDRPTAAPAHTHACTADPGEVYTFRTYETQTGRALSLPRGQRCSPAVAASAAVACRLAAAPPGCPGCSRSS